MRPRRLPRALVSAIDASKILGVRAGARSQHRFVGIWVVVVEGRVLARSWTLKPGGWYSTFLEDPLGEIQVGERRVKVRAARVGSERIRDQVEKAYALKYPTPGSRHFVRGFRSARRREATIEFLPRQSRRSAQSPPRAQTAGRPLPLTSRGERMDPKARRSR